MAWPPTIPPADITDTTAQAGRHPADHNAITDALRALVDRVQHEPIAMATIPGMSWFVAAGAGSSAGNPRVCGLGNLYKVKATDPFTGTPTGIVVNEAGTYVATYVIPVKGAWSVSAGVRHARGASIVTGQFSHDSRGTWGNPAGVTGFDGNYVVTLSGQLVFVAAAGDSLQAAIYTAGGADAGSIVGGDGSQIIVRKVSNSAGLVAAT